MQRTLTLGRFRTIEQTRRAGRWILHALPTRWVRFVSGRRSAAALVVAALGGFAALAWFAVTSEATLLGFDQAVQALILESRTAWLNEAMKALTFLGTRYVIGAASIALLAWSLVTKRHRTFVLVIVGAVLLNPFLEVGFKELVDRVRPAVDQLLPGNGPSFPSGHVLAAVGFYGLVPLFVWEATKNAWARFASWFGSLGVVAVVTVSRPYLDVHWTTDAVAGLLLGSVLVVAAYQVFLRLAPTASGRSLLSDGGVPA